MICYWLSSHCTLSLTELTSRKTILRVLYGLFLKKIMIRQYLFYFENGVYYGSIIMISLFSDLSEHDASQLYKEVFQNCEERLDFDGRNGLLLLRILLQMATSDFSKLTSTALSVMFRHFTQFQEFVEDLKQVVCCFKKILPISILTVFVDERVIKFFTNYSLLSIKLIAYFFCYMYCMIKYSLEWKKSFPFISSLGNCCLQKRFALSHFMVSFNPNPWQTIKRISWKNQSVLCNFDWLLL